MFPQSATERRRSRKMVKRMGCSCNMSTYRSCYYYSSLCSDFAAPGSPCSLPWSEGAAPSLCGGRTGWSSNPEAAGWQLLCTCGAGPTQRCRERLPCFQGGHGHRGHRLQACQACPWAEKGWEADPLPFPLRITLRCGGRRAQHVVRFPRQRLALDNLQGESVCGSIRLYGALFRNHLTLADKAHLRIHLHSHLLLKFAHLRCMPICAYPMKLVNMI